MSFTLQISRILVKPDQVRYISNKPSCMWQVLLGKATFSWTAKKKTSLKCNFCTFGTSSSPRDLAVTMDVTMSLAEINPKGKERELKEGQGGKEKRRMERTGRTDQPSEKAWELIVQDNGWCQLLALWFRKHCLYNAQHMVAWQFNKW